MEPIIVVEDLVKQYKGAPGRAVDGVSFTVARGELFALLGPNGAGKTTTLSILTTTLAPTSGRVKIAGYDLDREAARVRREIGIIFQKPSLDLNLTAEENVRMHAVLYGLYGFRPAYGLMPRAYQEQVRELSAVLGIEREMFQPIRTFSGGMQRKLEIVRSLIHNPRVLFLDEPTSGLDPASRRNLWEYLRRTRREQATTIFLTTHYLEEAEEADSICILNHGKIVSRGTPDQVKAHLIENYILIDAADRSSLRDELARLGLPFTETGAGGAPLVRIDLDGRSPHEILRSITTPLTTVQTHIPTLEDAYLSIIDEAKDV